MAKLGHHPSAKALALASISFTAAPFLGAVMLAARHSYDLRPLWIAFAAFTGALVVFGAGAHAIRVRSLVLLTAGGSLGGLGAATLAARVLDRESTSAVPLVLLGALFALSFAVSLLLDRLSRPGVLDQV
jgi:hypothetical protein